jgi:hypothetical protein
MGSAVTTGKTGLQHHRAAREHIAGIADLLSAVRLPEGSMRATAGTEVVIDVLVFQRRERARHRQARPGWSSAKSRSATRGASRSRG